MWGIYQISHFSSYPQLRYVREVALAKLLLVDVVVDVDRLLPYVPAKLLDEFARHTRSPHVSSEPVSAAVGREVILHPIRFGLVDAGPLRRFGDGGIDAVSVQPATGAVGEESFRIAAVPGRPRPKPPLQDEGGLVVEEDDPIGPLGRRLQPDTLLHPVDVVDVESYQLSSPDPPLRHVGDDRLYPQLRYMGEVAFVKLLLVDMIVDVDSLLSHVPT